MIRLREFSGISSQKSFGPHLAKEFGNEGLFREFKQRSDINNNCV